MYRHDGTGIVERFPDTFLAAFPVAIETLPMLHFFPGAKFLQVCTVGCNLSCGGCVSEILVGHAESLAASGTALTTGDLLRLAADHACTGIAFALNDPIASLPTFCRLAERAREQRLLVGCSTNGYMTEASALYLRERIDFANVGLKGSTDASYRACGAKSAAPAYRTIRLLHEGGVHVEVSIVYRRGGEEEVMGAARMLAAISPHIPLQVMRFVPFGDAGLGEEPTIYASEELCDRLRNILPWAYLFNSPGTANLTTFCPACKKPCIEREFFGPMGAHLAGEARTACACGHALPVRGAANPEVFYEPGMMGGYRATRGLEMVWAILACLGVEGQADLARIWSEVLRTGMLGKELHDRMNNIDAYLDLVMDFAHRAGREEAGRELCTYIRERLDFVRERVVDAPRPRVYYAMGHPLFALNPGRFEGKLVEAAGGTYVNRAIGREGKPGVSIPREEFIALAPEYLFTSGFLTSTVEDTLRYCAEHNLDVPAARNGRVYAMHPSWDFGSPRWILGLMTIANVLHPDRFAFRIDEEADEFYRRFYGVPYRASAANRSFAHPGTERR
ncbi:radical SAM protein [Methanoculleus chikugoensis]|uniref:Radical SAM protein n=2 Tax=Methanoculleus chikugoensis TaxID=118126 RepID=A0ABN5XK69_9EURY|nr:radical SAM protein [Methanoculleus chikugoensis]